MKLKKILLFLLASVFFSGSVVSTFGVSSFQTEAELNSSKEFRLGLINTGNTSLRVNFSARNVSRGSLDLDSGEVLLEPSETDRSPQGSGWYYLDGRYVEISYWSFSYKPMDLGGVDSFKLRVMAKPANSSGPAYGPTIAQLREIEYNINLTGGDGGTQSVWASGTYDNSEEQYEDIGRNSTSSGTENISESVNGTRNQNQTDRGGGAEEGPVNEFTFILLVTTLFIVVYVLYEV